MKNIMSLLFNTKIETTEQSGTERFILVAKDNRVTGLITKASKIMYQVEEMLREDIQQEVTLMLIKYTNSFSIKYNISLEEIYHALQQEESQLAARYWGYIKLCNEGHFKNIKEGKLLDKENNEYFYKENIQLISELKIKDFAGTDALEFIFARQNRLKQEIEVEEEMSSNYFVRWCKENAKNILTKKQYKFLIGDVDINNKDNKKMREAISKRFLKAYSKDFDAESKNSEREYKIKILNTLIKSNEISLYKELALKNNIITDAVYTKETTTDIAKYFTKIISGQAKYNKQKLDGIKVLLIKERNKIRKNL